MCHLFLASILTDTLYSYSRKEEIVLFLSPRSLTTSRQVKFTKSEKMYKIAFLLLVLEIQEWLLCFLLSVSTPWILSLGPNLNLSFLYYLIREASSPVAIRVFCCCCCFNFSFSWLRQSIASCANRQSFDLFGFLARWGWGFQPWRLKIERQQRGLLVVYPQVLVSKKYQITHG